MLLLPAPTNLLSPSPMHSYDSEFIAINTLLKYIYFLNHIVAETIILLVEIQIDKSKITSMNYAP